MNVLVSIEGFEEIIPKDGTENYIVYNIRVKSLSKGISNDITSRLSMNTANQSDAGFYVVQRRYSDFLELHKTLKLQGYKNLLSYPFPTKRSFLQSKLDVAASRKPVLEQYLQEIMTMSPTPPEIISFLQNDAKLSAGSISRESSSSEVEGDEKSTSVIVTTATTTATTTTASPIAAATILSKTAVTKEKEKDKVNMFSNMSFMNPVNIVTSLTQSLTNIGDMGDVSPRNEDSGGSGGTNSVMSTNKETTVSSNMQFQLSKKEEKLIFKTFQITMMAVAVAVLYHIVFLILHPIRSMNSTLMYVHSFFMKLKVSIETMVIVFVLLMTIHRGFGYLMTWYLQSKLRKTNGSCNLTIDWISFRIGLDRNEIIFHGITFHNPPLFKQTPYFIRINQTTFVIDLESIFAVFISGNKKKSIHINHMELDGIHFYIEKAKYRSDGLNMWAALGASNESQEREVQNYVSQAMAAASNIANPFSMFILGRKGNMDQQEDDNQAYDDQGQNIKNDKQASQSQRSSQSPSIQHSIGSHISSLTSFLPHHLSPKSQSQTVAKRNSQNTDQSISRSKTQTQETKNIVKEKENENDNNSENKINYPAIYGNKDEKNNNNVEDEEEDDDGDDDDDDDEGHSLSRGPWKHVDSDDENDDENENDEASHAWTTNTSSSDRGTKDSKPSPPPSSSSSSVAVAGCKGWGIPYIFEVDRLTVRDFKLHAQDLLSAQHIDTKSAPYIDIRMINMTRKDLTKPAPYGSKNKYRRGIYFDELTWKIVFRTVTELFKTNYLSMIAIMAFAVSNQTTNVVLDAANMATQGVSNVMFNYNPVELYKATSKTIQSVVNAKESIPRSPSANLLGVTALRVRIIRLREVKFPNGKSPSTVKCMLRLKCYKLPVSGVSGTPLVTENEEFNSELIKSSVLTKGRDEDIVFNETYDLKPLISLDCIFYLRVFEAGLISKNKLVCEMSLPIRPNLRSGSSDLLSNNRNSSVNKVDSPEPKIGVKDEIVSWHALTAQDPSLTSKNVGIVKLGLSLV